MKTTLIPELCAGGDLEIANAARRSFGRSYTTFRTDAEGPRVPRGLSDEGLIRDLIAKRHLLPFRHPQLSFECDAPLPVARQLGKHQVGLTWSETSRRYKTKDIAFYRFNGTWRSDVKDRKQGSGELLDTATQEKLEELQAFNIKTCITDYELALVYGAAPEQARFLLPQSMEVVWTWTGSFLAWCHLWDLRSHPDVQQETRDFVYSTEPAVLERFPYSWPVLRARQVAAWDANH
jgi:thymidylate synthase (FAD)